MPTIDTSDNTIITTNALLYRQEDGEVRFLLANENDGNWGLPGGAKDIEDENLVVTLERELREELGLAEGDYVIHEIPIRREFEYNHLKSNRYGKHGIVQFFVVRVIDASRIVTSNELAETAWFTKEDAVEKLTFDYIREGFEEASALLPDPGTSPSF